MSSTTIGAIAGGISAGAILFFAIGFVLWRKWRPSDSFYDVPGNLFKTTSKGSKGRITWTNLIHGDNIPCLVKLNIFLAVC